MGFRISRSLVSGVMALACVAMMESPMAYHGIVFPASRYLFTLLLPRLRYSP